MSALARRLDVALVVLALAAAIAAGLHDLHDPWDGSLRGRIVSTDTHRFVHNYLELGLGATRGGGVILVDPLRPERPYFYGNHPATAPLLLLPLAIVFGDDEDTLRAGATLLWLPAVLALWRLARRWLAPPASGAAALLLATVPVNVEWGPSPHLELVVLPALLLAALAFVRQLERPSLGRAAALGLAVVFAGLTDWPGFFVAPLLLVFAAAWPERRRALLLALRVAPLLLVSLALVHVHTAWFMRQPIGLWDFWHGLFRDTQGVVIDPLEFVRVHLEYAYEGVGALGLLLLAAGAMMSWGGAPAERRRLVAAGALMLPGLLNVLLFRHHALIHPFWGLFGTPGVALLAAAPCAGALDETAGASRGARLRAGAALALVLVAAGLGLRAGFETMTSWRSTEFHDLGVVLDARFARGDVVASPIYIAPADIYVRATLLSPVETPQAVDALAARYAPPAFTGRLAFVLPERDGDGALARHLRETVEPEPCGRWLLFALR